MGLMWAEESRLNTTSIKFFIFLISMLMLALMLIPCYIISAVFDMLRILFAIVLILPMILCIYLPHKIYLYVSDLSYLSDHEEAIATYLQPLSFPHPIEELEYINFKFEFELADARFPSGVRLTTILNNEHLNHVRAIRLSTLHSSSSWGYRATLSLCDGYLLLYALLYFDIIPASIAGGGPTEKEKFKTYLETEWKLARSWINDKLIPSHLIPYEVRESVVLPFCPPHHEQRPFFCSIIKQMDDLETEAMAGPNSEKKLDSLPHRRVNF